jgi:arylsulfatase A-like enzyme
MKNVSFKVSHWLIMFLLFFNDFSITSQNLSKSSKPNIVFILVDDLGKEWVSSYGAEDIVTPNIDKLAKSGLKFNNAYGMPQCTPSRLTLLTGQYPFRHGWVNHWDVPRAGGGAHFDENLNPVLVQEIKKAGYKTCIAGKWQIDDFRVEPDALTKIGFDAYCMWTGKEGKNPMPSGNRYYDPYVFTKNGSSTYKDAFGPDVFKDFINDFIRNNKDEPMFIYYPMVLTHTPFVTPPMATAKTPLEKHKSMVTYTDYVTSQIVETLEQEGIRENTVIIWTTDNGTTNKVIGNRNGFAIKGAKTKTTEAGVCLPFIVSWPAVIKPNSLSNALVDFTDILPTCLDLCGVPIGHTLTSKDKEFVIDGRSFKEVLLGNKETIRDWILAMGGGNKSKLTENGVENMYVYRDRVLRNERYKLKLGTKKKPLEFYDLLEDPMETKNIINDLGKGSRKENFHALYKATLNFPDKDSDPKYIPNPSQIWDVKVTAKSQVWKK